MAELGFGGTSAVDRKVEKLQYLVQLCLLAGMLQLLQLIARCVLSSWR